MNKQNVIHCIESITDIQKAHRSACAHLISAGVQVGNTMECDLITQYVTTIGVLEMLLPDIKQRIPVDVWDLERREYASMEKTLFDACRKEFRRDITGRRGISLHPGCISYQHCYIRDNALRYTVHMRGMDTRKYIADMYYILHAGLAVAMLRPQIIRFIHVKLCVDCFHSYTQEVPL